MKKSCWWWTMSDVHEIAMRWWTGQKLWIKTEHMIRLYIEEYHMDCIIQVAQSANVVFSQPRDTLFMQTCCKGPLYLMCAGRNIFLSFSKLIRKLTQLPKINRNHCVHVQCMSFFSDKTSHHSFIMQHHRILRVSLLFQEDKHFIESPT